MLHNLQLLLLRRAQQGRKGRVRYIVAEKPVYYSAEIEDLIDRFDLELPETEAVFVGKPPEPLKTASEASVVVQTTQYTRPTYQSLLGVIKELTEALSKIDKEEQEKSEKVSEALEIVRKTAKKVKKRQEEELLLEFLL